MKEYNNPIDILFIDEVKRSKIEIESTCFENRHRITISKYKFYSQGIKIPPNPLSMLLNPNLIKYKHG